MEGKIFTKILQKIAFQKEIRCVNNVLAHSEFHRKLQYFNNYINSDMKMEIKIKKEVTVWGKYEHYQNQFKRYGFTLKITYERNAYGLNSHDFQILINNESNMTYHRIDFDILDCILFGYVNAFSLCRPEINRWED